MTTRTYTTGLIVSAALAITGVLWHQPRSPYVAGEDIAAILADTLTVLKIASEDTSTNAVALISRRWYWQDMSGDNSYGAWVAEPEIISATSFTVTAFRASASLRDASIALHHSVSGWWWYSTGVRYFLDRRTFDGSAGQFDFAVAPSWGTNPVYAIANSWNFGRSNIVFNANLIDVDVNAVALKDRIVTGTNRYGFSGAPAVSTLAAASIFAGAQNYSAFTNRLAGEESWWTYAGISPVSYLLEPVEVLRANAGQGVCLSSDWIDRTEYDASTWPYKATDHMWFDDNVESYRPGVNITPFISKASLDVFRRVLTNMTRTVEFNPACSVIATSYSYSGTNAMTTATNAIDATMPITFFGHNELISSWVAISGSSTNHYTNNVFSASWSDLSITPTSIASNCFASGMVDRVRLYAVTEASTPGIWYPLDWIYNYDVYFSLSNLNSYVGASLSANQTETYGYPITHCSIPDIHFPRSAPTQPKDWLMTCGYVYETVTPSYFSTNQIWNLIGDVSHPATPPTFSLAATSHARTDLLTPTQAIDVEGYEGSTYRHLTASWRYHTMRLSKLMLIVDWSITLKSSGGYTNAP
jgi:hypothetical protein